MRTYKYVDVYDRSTGKKLKPILRYDKLICDYTGEEIEEATIRYIIDYDSIDPCFGNGLGERWLHDTEYRDYYFQLFGQSEYCFKDAYIVEDMIANASEEFEELIYDFNQLFRWSRGRMLQEVYKNNPKDLEKFIDYDSY